MAAIIVKKPVTITKLHKALNELRARSVKRMKGFDAKRFLGKVRFLEDPLTYQRRIRSEWD